MPSSRHPGAYERRLPLIMATAVLFAPAFTMGSAPGSDPHGVRISFVLSAVALVPVALAGRVGDVADTAGFPVTVHDLVGPLRLVAGLSSASLLLVLASATPSHAHAAAAAAGAVATASVLTFLLPGASTPDGSQVRSAREAGIPWRKDAIAGLARRSSQLLVPGAPYLLLTGRAALALAAILATAMCHLAALTATRFDQTPEAIELSWMERSA